MSLFQHWFEPNTSRREVLRTAGRYAALSVLATLGLYSVTNTPEVDGEDNCPELNLCKGCGILQKCLLPQARFVRKANKESADA